MRIASNAAVRAVRLAALLALCAPLDRAGAQTSATPGNSATDPLAVKRLEQALFRQAMQRVAPSVVTIETIGGTQPVEQPSPGPPAPREGRGPGRRPGGPRPPQPQARPEFIIADGPTTGLIWSKQGHILTSAFNFVREPSVITVVLPDGRRFVGELLARDEVRRLAMLKIEADDLPVPTWVDDAQALRVGQWALALGRGFGGRDPSMSAGIISGLNRKSGLAIQTDAKLSPANFGGPLIDLEGRVIGLCVPMGMGSGLLAGVEWYDSGIGFAIPHGQAFSSARDLAVGHNLRRGLLGLRVDPRFRRGVRVAGMGVPSPAQRAGLADGDVIVAIDGKPVREYAELQRIMAARLAGEKVVLRIKRGEEQLDLTLVLAVPEDIGEVPGGGEEEAQTRPAQSQPDQD